MKSRASGAAAGTMAGLGIERNREADARSGEYLKIQQQNHATGQARAARETAMAARGDEGLPGFIYGAISGQDPTQVMSQFNQYGNMKLQGYSLNPDNSIALTGADGQQATIPASIVHGFMQKFQGINLSATGLRSKKPDAYAVGLGVEAFKRTYNTDDLEPGQWAALKQGIANQLPDDEIATGLDIPRIESDATMQVADIDKQIKKHNAKIAKGDYRHWGNKRTDIVADLKKHKAVLQKEMESPVGVRDTRHGLTGDQAPPEDPINSQGETISGLAGRMPMPKQDLNGDGKINDFDKEYAFAVRVVDLMKKSPDAKRAMQKYWGPSAARKMERCEALARSVRKRLGQDADKQVESVMSPPGQVGLR